MYTEFTVYYKLSSYQKIIQEEIHLLSASCFSGIISVFLAFYFQEIPLKVQVIYVRNLNKYLPALLLITRPLAKALSVNTWTGVLPKAISTLTSATSGSDVFGAMTSYSTTTLPILEIHQFDNKTYYLNIITFLYFCFIFLLSSVSRIRIYNSYIGM